MPEMKITVDVNLHADSDLAALIENLADCWASDIIVRAGGEPTHRMENVVPSSNAPTQDFGATPVPAAKEREINELNRAAQQTESVSTQDEKLTESELVDIRAKAQAFMKGDAANKDKVKAWLSENGLARVTEMPRSAVASFLDLIGAGAKAAHPAPAPALAHPCASGGNS